MLKGLPKSATTSLPASRLPTKAWKKPFSVVSISRGAWKSCRASNADSTPALAVRPEVLLMDEPCSALDPRSTAVIEELIQDLRSELAIVIVTHNLQQAYRVGDHVAFMYLGDLVEYNSATTLFGSPREKRTQEYVSGAFG